MARKTKSEDELTFEAAEKQAERQLADYKKKINAEIFKDLEKLQNKNAKFQKTLLKKYKDEKKKAEEEVQEFYREIQESTTKELADAWNIASKDAAKVHKELLQKANEEAITNGVKDGLKKAGIDIGKGGIKIDMSGLGKAADDAVNSAAKVFTEYQGKVNTRLIGYLDTTNNAFKQIVDRNTKASPFYRTTEYLTNINNLVEQGIVQNLEQRAFLATVKDELISTFDATNDTLLRLVRIQNEDSTAARAGMEAYLNRFLNQTFENTEYLKQAFDTTSSALSEATALLSAEQATSFEYVVQKWLGALYSEGMSAQGINSLATAIGQLASGDINSLVGTNIGNLIAMASKGDLATYFKDGLTEATADLLMNSIVTYLQDLNKSGNNVVRSQLANVFGLSISDLRAASNVRTSAVIGNNLGYGDAESYVATLLGTAGTRMSLVSQMENIVQNAIFSLGEGIVGSELNYMLYRAGGLIDSLTGGAQLGLSLGPVQLTSSIGNLMKTASLGISAITNITDVLLGGAKLTGTMLETYNSLGGLVKGDVSTWGVGLGSGSGSSESAYIGNANTSSLFKNSLGSVRDTLTSNRELLTGSANAEDDIATVVPNIYKYLINTFDGKMDTLIKLSAINANYSVVDTIGNNLTNSMKTIMGGNSVVVQANPVEKEDLTMTISESVVGIYELLNKVVNGEVQFAVRDVSNVMGAYMNTANMIGYNAWTGATR